MTFPPVTVLSRRAATYIVDSRHCGQRATQSEGCHKLGRLAKIGFRPPELGVEVRTPRPGLLPRLLMQGSVLANMGWGLVSLAAITQGYGCHSNPLQVCSEAAVSCAKAHGQRGGESGLLR
ncbi:uncharacterized protein LOC143281663 [Babylonia areolata]|uniref:uncharacterized protein LOC143281663 n=1 Tax=Babylonia areolata TaxID=304850 RepID=UPI003FCF8173